MTATIFEGDCLEQMQIFDDNEIDAIVTDPPYGLEFMGKKWDKLNLNVPFTENEKGGLGGYKHHIRFGNKGTDMQEWHYNWAVEALRVVKPGAHMLAFGGTRTHHRLMVAIEDAGWEIRDTLGWIYGSGFPKSLDMGKAIDKKPNYFLAPKMRDILNQYRIRAGLSIKQINDHFGFATTGSGMAHHWMTHPTQPTVPTEEQYNELKRLLDIQDTSLDILYLEAQREIIGKTIGYKTHYGGAQPKNREINLTIPATDAAKQWNGWGTALKPAWEPIILCRKPLEGTVAQTVLKWGTGGINIDGCRIEGEPWKAHDATGLATVKFFTNGDTPIIHKEPHDKGRFPANLILSYPEDEYILRDDVTSKQLHELAEWLDANPK